MRTYKGPIIQLSESVNGGVTGLRLERAVATEWSAPTSQNRSALRQREAGIDFRD